MSISFVVLTWNSEKDIEKCVESIKDQCIKEELEYKLFIVDNGSTDSTINILKQLGRQNEIEVTYLEKNFGTTYPRNIALKKVTTEFVCVLDSDTEIINVSFKELFQFFKNNPKVGLIAPQLVLENGIVQHSAKKFPTFSEKLFKIQKILGIGEYNQNDFYSEFPFTEVSDIDTAISACWILPKRVLDSVGLLDENIFYAPEDIDYCLRIWKAGFRIVYFPNMKIMHKTQQISHRDPFGKVARSHFKGLLYYYKKHGYWFSRKKIYKKLNMEAKS